MTSIQQRVSSHKLVHYASGAVLSLMLLTAPTIVQAHVGHNQEFQGDASQMMKPIEVDAKTAETMGIKVEAIADSATLSIPSSSVIDANGQQLVYLQEGNTFKPVVVKSGSVTGDVAAVQEGNLKAGDRIVTQGATLLYSQSLRSAPAEKNSVAQPQPEKSEPNSMGLWVGIGGAIAACVAIAAFAKKKSRPYRN